jgi:hypothetical protein
MFEYQFEIVDNHIIIIANECRILLDSGAPNSIGKNNTFIFFEKKFSVSKNYLGLTASQLSEFVGTQIDYLLGGDILSKMYFIIDWKRKLITFSNSPIPFEGKEFSIELFMNIPVMEAIVGGELIKVFFDTGAKISYLGSSYTENYSSIDSQKDFYPGVGQFETALYDIPINILGSQLNLSFGNLPELLQMTLMFAGTEGIIGNEVFQYFIVYFSFPQKKIIVKKI